MRVRQKQIIIRMTEEEYNTFKKRLDKTGLSQNDFAIKCLNSTQINIVEGITELMRELRAVGNNLNQIARAINSGKVDKLPAIEELEKGVAEVWRSLRRLMAGKA